MEELRQTLESLEKRIAALEAEAQERRKISDKKLYERFQSDLLYGACNATINLVKSISGYSPDDALTLVEAVTDLNALVEHLASGIN